MLPCGAVHEAGAILRRAAPKENGHDKSVREADLGAVHSTVARCLENGQDAVQLWPHDQRVERGCGIGHRRCGREDPVGGG